MIAYSQETEERVRDGMNFSLPTIPSHAGHPALSHSSTVKTRQRGTGADGWRDGERRKEGNCREGHLFSILISCCSSPSFDHMSRLYRTASTYNPFPSLGDGRWRKDCLSHRLTRYLFPNPEIGIMMADPCLTVPQLHLIHLVNLHASTPFNIR